MTKLDLTTVEKPVRALAKELEGRGQLEGIVAEIVAHILKNIKTLESQQQ